MKEPSEKTCLRDRFYNLFPTLERGERKQLVERIAVGAEGGVDFIMLLLASTLASLGLLEGSTAVVIGAMLVAPLMGPLVAAGFALTQGNLRLFRDAISVCGLGIIIGLTNDRLFVAGNAAILFATNLVAIILGAYLVFILLEAPESLQPEIP